MAIGPGSEVGSFVQGMPRLGAVQTMFTLDVGLELYPSATDGGGALPCPGGLPQDAGERRAARHGDLRHRAPA